MPQLGNQFELTFGAEIGLIVLIVLIGLVAIVIAQSPLPKSLRLLILAGLLMRLVGAMTRFLVLVFYYGVGDATTYFRRGVLMADFFQNLDWTPITDSQYWFSQSWWGTTFMYWASGFVISFIGPTILGEFIVFSLLSFLGLVAFVVAFKRSFPAVPFTRYARWVWLLPSLWFWPSSVGKEALVLLGLGLATLGVVGRRGRIHWIPLAFGSALMFMIRPQMAALFLLVAFVAYWLGQGKRWTPGKTLQGVVVAVVSLSVVYVGLSTTGMESFDFAGMEDYVATEGGREVGGGSSIEAPAMSPLGLPVAIINVLFRPFPWEAGNIMMLMSSLEIVLLWGLILFRRRQLLESLRGWRRSRLLCLAGAFILVYSISFGMTVSNLGIIARQRIFVFPFLFVFLEAVVPAARGIPRPFGSVPARPPASAGSGGPRWPVPTPDAPGRSSSR